MARWLPALLFALSGNAWAEKVLVLSYYDFPPFVEQNGGGLSMELCRLLEERSKGRYQFELLVVPRLRLDAMLLKPGRPVLVPWVVPDFFKDPQRFQWGGVLMPDSVVMLTMPGRSVQLDSRSALRGLRFGGVLGHQYPFGELEKALREQVVLRADSAGPEQNYVNVVLGRVDFTIMAESTYHYLRAKDLERTRGKAEPVAQQLPSSVFHRTYFSTGAKPELAAFLRAELEPLRVVRGGKPVWVMRMRGR